MITMLCVYNSGLVYLREGLFHRARDMFTEVIKIDRKNRKARNYINSIDLALEEAKGKGKVSISQGANFNALMNKAERAFKVGDLNSAFKYVNDALEVHPDAVNPLNNLATLYILKGDYENALKQYRKLSKLQPDNIVAKKNIVWLNGVKLFIDELNIPADLTSLTDNERKRFCDSLINKSDDVFSKGNVHESIFYLQKAVSVCPQKVDIYKKLSEVYLKLHIMSEALFVNKTALEITPDDADIKANIKKIENIIGYVK